MAVSHGKPDLKGWGTKLIHAGRNEEESLQPVVTPIYRSTAYKLSDKVYRAIKKYSQTEGRGKRASEKDVQELRYRTFYTRDANPNVAVVQRKMAALEGCEDAVATSSGMGAIATALLSAIKGKKYLVSTPHIYGGSFSFIYHELKEMFDLEIISLDDFLVGKWKKSIAGHEIAGVYVESLSSPFLLIPPLEAIGELRDAWFPEMPIIVDNTFLTPVNFKPFSVLDQKRDLVLYSATKYLGGHGDVMAGIVCGSRQRINGVWEKMTLYGCCLDAETAYHLERGLKTLHLRMERHNQNMHGVFKYLTEVSEKYGLQIWHPLSGQCPVPSFAKVLVEQRRLGGMMTFNIAGKNEKDGIRFMDLLDEMGVIKHAPSLGGAESLISMPYNTSQTLRDQQKMLGLKKYGCLLRLSVGIEDIGDIVASLERAFEKISG